MSETLQTFDGRPVLRIVEIDPPRVFAFSESPPEQMTRETADLIHMELQSNDGGCLMIFTHTFTDRPAAASYGTGWKGCLDALERQLAGDEEETELDWISYHEQLVHQFGLDEGTLDKTADVGEVRFTRQLMRQPIEKFWAVAVGANDPAVGMVPPLTLVPDGVNAGTVSEVEHEKLFAFDWLNGGQPAGSVRWELSPGPGGARIDLTHSGTGDSADLLDLWKAHLEQLVQRVIAAAWSENS